jgi:hypothetical protein
MRNRTSRQDSTFVWRAIGNATRSIPETAMKYDIQINKRTSRQPEGVDGQPVNHPKHASPVPVARRFPPVVQLLTGSDPVLEQQLAAVVRHSFQEGKPLKDICADLYRFARSAGFDATIGVQEVYSTSMPSFRGQTVISALLMLDMRPLWSPGESVLGSYGHVG